MASGVLQVLRLIDNLKHVPRTGWVEHGVAGPETIAAHMYRMAMMAILVDVPGVNKDTAVKMALVHDLAEAIVGDISPRMGVAKAEKHRREAAAMAEIVELLRPLACAEEVHELWDAYERQDSAEARFVKELDRLDMVVQARTYETRTQVKPLLAAKQMTELLNNSLESFFESTRGFFTTPLLKQIDGLVREERENKAV